MTVGLDTGFFVRLLQADATATEVWGRVARREAMAAISCISLFELDRLGLKGAVERKAADALVEELPHLCRVLWLDGPALLHDAARVAHGNGLSMADSIILTSLMAAKAEEIYTTDSDLSAYAAGPKMIRL